MPTKNAKSTKAPAKKVTKTASKKPASVAAIDQRKTKALDALKAQQKKRLTADKAGAVAYAAVNRAVLVAHNAGAKNPEIAAITGTSTVRVSQIVQEVEAIAADRRAARSAA